MADLNDLGNITANCRGCDGALASYVWSAQGHGPLGMIQVISDWSAPYARTSEKRRFEFRLYVCSGCGRGALATIRCKLYETFPHEGMALVAFHPEALDRLKLPAATPKGIAHEFREGESCLSAQCSRAAAGMFRSVLDKTLRANGYKLKEGTPLQQQIDSAAADGVITEARRLKAHEDVRVLGNDVLHDEWYPIEREAVLLARHYVQRVLEDFYDDRPTSLKLLRSKGRVPDEDKPPPSS